MIRQEIFDFKKEEKLDWNNFIEGDENREALLYLTQWPHWTTNGLLITGQHGVGKTHLAALWAQSANAVYLLKDSLRYDPRDLFENDCNFVLDDAQNFLIDQHWLFDFYNVAKEKNRFFLMLDTLPASIWNVSLKDLASRLSLVPVINIKNYDNDLLKKITKKIMNDWGISIPDNVIDYIINTSERDIEHISRLLYRLDAIALQQQKSISISFVKKYLGQD